MANIKWHCENCDNLQLLDFDPIKNWKKWNEVKCEKCGCINDIPKIERLEPDEDEDIQPTPKKERDQDLICDSCKEKIYKGKYKGKQTASCPACQKLLVDKIRKDAGMQPLSKERTYKDYLRVAAGREKDEIYHTKKYKRDILDTESLEKLYSKESEEE